MDRRELAGISNFTALVAACINERRARNDQIVVDCMKPSAWACA
jgi:hypothetical protein